MSWPHFFRGSGQRALWEFPKFKGKFFQKLPQEREGVGGGSEMRRGSILQESENTEDKKGKDH